MCLAADGHAAYRLMGLDCWSSCQLVMQGTWTAEASIDHGSGTIITLGGDTLRFPVVPRHYGMTLRSILADRWVAGSSR